MGLSVTVTRRFKVGNGWGVAADVTFDSSYPTNGEPLTAATLGLNYINEMCVENASGYSFDYDKTNSKLIAYSTGGSHTHTFTGTAITPEDVTVKDSDTAASAGVAVYLHTKDGRSGWFEFVSPTNANGTGTIRNGGSGYFISDNDAAATGGVAIYFDEDAATTDRRFLCVSPSAKDIYVPIAGSNQCLVIAHSASAASAGVQVYFDEDAANTYERLLFVSPTNANGTGATDDTLLFLAPVAAGTNASGTAATAEVSNTTNLSTVTTQVMAYGY